MSDQMSRNLFKPGSESAAILHAWWKGLEDQKGERAALRRTPSPSEVVFSPAYHRLFRTLPINRVRLASVAGLVSHIKEDTGTPKSLPQQMASPKIVGGNAIVSGLRFRRILAISDKDALYPLMIRIIRLLGGRLNLLSLAESVYWWNERVWKDWAYDYYAMAPKEK
ncbi:MAG: type I-E CRISPR-associated protein Cse2/CasB [Nitrospiria bacterium]